MFIVVFLHYTMAQAAAPKFVSGNSIHVVKDDSRGWGSLKQSIHTCTMIEGYRWT